MDKIELGDKAKDTITGFSGVVVCISEWLHGCRRIAIQPDKLDKDGCVQKAIDFDEPQIKLVKKATTKRKTDTGGDRPMPQRKPSPTKNAR